MNDIDIKINGESIDLKENIVFEQSFQAFDISSFTTSKSNSTSSIVVPATGKNKRIFGIEGGSNNNDQDRRQKIRVDIIQAGVYTLGNAQAILQGWDDEEIRFNAYKGAIDLFSVIGDAELSEIDFSDLNHYRNFSTIISKRNTTEGIIYPFIDYGGGFNYNQASIDARSMLPSIFAKTIVERIIERQGFTLTGRILDDDYYNEYVIALTTINGGEDSDSSLTVARSQLAPTGQFLGDDSFPTQIKYVLSNCSSDLSGDDIIPCFRSNTFITSDVFSLTLIANPTVTAYRVQSDGAYKFRFIANVSAANLDSQFKCKVKIAIYNASPGSNTSNRFLDVEKIITAGINTYELVTGLETLTQFDFVVGVVEIPSTLSGPQEEINIFNASMECIQVIDADQVYNTIYDVDVNLPEIKQSEFLKAIFATFQIISIVDPDNGSVHLWSFNDAYLDVGNAVDYSGKVDTSRPIKRQPRINGFSKENFFTYSNEEGFGLAETYGSGTLSINDESILSERRTIVELPFSASNQRYNGISGIIPVAMYLPVYTYGTTNYVGGIEEIRVGFLKRISSGFSILYGDTVTTQSVTTNIAYGYFFFDDASYLSLGFDDAVNASGLISTYYAGIVSILDNAEIVTCEMSLNANDIAKLDLTKPVYISELGANFIINRISGYRPGVTSTVELIRM